MAEKSGSDSESARATTSDVDYRLQLTNIEVTTRHHTLGMVKVLLDAFGTIFSPRQPVAVQYVSRLGNCSCTLSFHALEYARVVHVCTALTGTIPFVPSRIDPPSRVLSKQAEVARAYGIAIESNALRPAFRAGALLEVPSTAMPLADSFTHSPVP